MSNNKTLKVFSSTAVAGMIAAAMMSSQAFAAVDAYSVKVGDQVYKYEKAQLEKAFLDSKTGEKSALYEDFTKKLGEAKGFYAFNDTKNGYVDYSSIESKFLEAKGAAQKFDVDAFTESKDAKIVKVSAVKKAVVNKDGKVEYVDEVGPVDEKGDLKVTSVEALSLKQVKINFNKAVTDQDKIDDIEDKENYTLEDKDGDEVNSNMVKEVKLDDSKKFAILTFNDKVDSKGKYLIENQEKYKLTIDDDVTGDEVEKELIFKDTKLPEVKKLEVIGKDTLKVTFTEPVKPYNINDLDKPNVEPELDDDDFEINGGDLSVDKVELVNNNTEANIVVGTDFKQNDEVKVRVKSSVTDYAGLTVVSNPQTVKVKEDTKVPVIASVKKIEDEENSSGKSCEKVTLVFDKDIKFKDGDKDLSKYYHTTDKENGSNRPNEVKIDGKELILYFDEDTFGNASTSIYVKSDAVESRWEVKNEKLSARVEKEKDNTSPEIAKLEQHKDYNNKIKIKFSEKVKCSDDSKDSSATKTKNYTLEDSNGREWKINKVSRDGNDKEFIIETTKDLDSDLKYKLTVENIEDKAGNPIKKVTKDLSIKDNDCVKESDITVKVYSAGTTSQKIVVDFDSEMDKGTGRYGIKDLSKYTLVARNARNELVDVFNGKSSINMSEFYKSEIKVTKSGKAVEITIPGKEERNNKFDLKDNQYNLKGNLGKDELKKELGTDFDLYLQIDRVADANGNITDRNYTKKISNSDYLGKGSEGSINFDKNDNDYKPQIISPEELFVAFTDKVDFNLKDIKVVAANNKEEVEKIAEEFKKNPEYEIKESDSLRVLKTSSHSKGKTTDGDTTATIKFDNSLRDRSYDDSKYNHIFTYDGKYKYKYTEKDVAKENILDVYVFTVPNKKVNGKDVSLTKNDYDETLQLGKESVVKVADKLAPIVKDNDLMDKNARQGGEDNTDQYVQYWYDKDNNSGAIVLNFEENIDPSSVSRSSFELNEKDFKDASVESVIVKDNRIIVKVKDLTDGTENVNGEKVAKKVELERGDQLVLKGIRDINDNEAKNLTVQIGDFKLDAEPVELSELKNAENVKAVEDMIAKLPEKDAIKLENKVAVEEARKAYDKLEDKKGDIKAGTVKKLTDAEAKIEELDKDAKDAANTEAANAFKITHQEAIALTAENVTADDEQKLNGALDAYSNLEKGAQDKVAAEKGKLDAVKAIVDAVNTEVAKYDEKSPIVVANTVVADNEISLIASGKSAADKSLITAIAIEGDKASDYLKTEGNNTLKLKKQAEKETSDNLTYKVKLTIKKNKFEKQVTVTVTVTKKDK